MPSDTAFRLSLYLSMSLACVCVGYAEQELFPEVPFIAAASVAALILLYRLESRVELLSIPDANRLGLVVGLLNLGWAAFRIVQVSQRPEPGGPNIQVIIVGLFGPLLVTLIPAKLARREQHAGDFWGLHAMGLVAVSLSGAMADDATGSTFVALYAAAAVWSVSLFYLRRAAGAVAAIPNRPAAQPIAGVLADAEPRSGLWPAVALCLAAAAVASPLYLVTPRSPGDRLEFGKPRVEIGYAATQMIDLNQTGNLEENPAPAFEVAVGATTGLVPDLPDSQLWRGRVLRHYSKGTWEPSDLPLPGVDAAPRSQLQWTPPVLGPGQCTLSFTVPPSLPGQFLAEPIVWAPDQPVPVASATATGLQPWLWGGDGSFLWSGRIGRHETHRYVQVWQPRAESDLTPRFRILDADPGVKLRSLTQNPVRRVKEYADALVEGMVRDGRLPPNCSDPVTDLPRREFHDAIARAFTNHLATSPEFVYTTKLRRLRKDLDPVEEFLFHTRSGHCERFASALALLLRSQGVPAVLVLGFKGWERTADPQRYVVKQEHAHAWVDALIVEFEPGTHRGERPVSRWRTLDPTPGGQALSETPASGWAANARARLQGVVRDVLARGSAERRWQAFGAVVRWVQRWEVLLGLSLFVVAATWGRRLRRRATSPPAAAESALLARLLTFMASYGFTPQPGDTPREFADALARVLGQSAATAGVAGVPGEWAEAYYESRFGGHAVTPERLDVLEAGLRGLGRCLTNRTALATPQPKV